MIAPFAASACVPSDSIVVTTAGRPVGIAAIARLIPIRNSSSKSSPRISPKRITSARAPAAMIVMRRVSWSSWRVSGVFSSCDLAEHPGDLADLGRHPRRRDHHLAAATSHGRVHVRHVDAVAERDLVAGHGVHGLQHGRALARQRRLLDLERRRQDQAAVGGDLVAGLERHDVAGNELLGGDVHALAVPAGVRMDQEHLLERGDALGGLALLVQAEDGVEHRQADDHDPGRPLLERDDADDRCAEQHELHEVAVLAEERVPAGLLLPLRELVRPDLGAAPVDLGRIEARTGIHAELCQRVRRGQSVPVCVSPAVDDCRHRSILKVRRRRRNRQGAPA